MLRYPYTCYILSLHNYSALFCFIYSKDENTYLIFLDQVFQWTGEQPPDRNRPLDAYYDDNLGRLMTYSMEVSPSSVVFLPLHTI